MRKVQTLLVVLSVTAGSTDVISFLGLNGLFTAQITGNVVLLAAHFVGQSAADVAQMLSVPVFIAVAGLTAMLADRVESSGVASLRPLLLLHFLLLAGFLALGVGADHRITISPNSRTALLAGMFGVSAMAVHNAIVQISFKGAPSTAVMTTNITRFAIDVGEVLLGRDVATAAAARDRAQRSLPVIIGFVAGCGLGAACEAALGLRGLVFPVGLALVALTLTW